MAATCIAAIIGASSIAAALVTGAVPVDAMGGQTLSLVLAGLTALAVVSAVALDS